MPTGVYEHEVALHTDTLLNREPCRLRREKGELICLECPLKECIYEYDDERERRKPVSSNRDYTIIFNAILGPEKKRKKRTKMGRPKKVVETQEVVEIPGEVECDEGISLDLPIHNISHERRGRDTLLSAMVGFPSLNPDPQPFWDEIMSKRGIDTPHD